MNQKEMFNILNLAFNNSPIGVLVTDGEGKVLAVNDYHSVLTDTPKENIVGSDIIEHVKNSTISNSSTVQVMKSGNPVIMEETVHKGKENERDIIVKSIPIKNKLGNIDYIITYVHDISEKRLLMKELEEAKMKNIKYDVLLRQIQGPGSDRFIYRSIEMERLIAKAKRVADTDSTVLITGESGVGKGVLAEYIHENSRRSNKPFLTVNCGAIPETLIESELFGYESGSFTGASSKGKSGILDSVNGGTLFLDEIGDMPYNLQVKVLRVIQDGEFFRIGGISPIKVDVRFLAATNLDLKSLISEGKFRKDLYYRLNVISLNVQPLRERIDDISVLAEFFLKRMNERHGVNKKFSKEAVERLMRSKLPGNVRELENIIERSVLFSQSDVIAADDIFDEADFDEIDITDNGIDIENMNFKKYIEGVEKEVLIKALEKYKTTAEVGRRIGLDQSTVSRKLMKYGINL